MIKNNTIQRAVITARLTLASSNIYATDLHITSDRSTGITFSGTESHSLNQDANWIASGSQLLYISGTAINFTGDIAVGTTFQNTSGQGIYAPSMTGDFNLTNNGTMASTGQLIYVPSNDVDDITIVNASVATMATTSPTQELLYFPIGFDAHNISITNAGIMTAVDQLLYVPASGSDLVINNSGTMTVTGTDDNVMYLLPATYTITNTGTMQITGGSGHGVDIRGGGTGTLTNTGLIRALGAGKYDIYNASTLTLNNDQGGSDALTITGSLPTNYNIIVNSTSDYGKLAVISGTGAMTFGIYSTSIVDTSATYTSVIDGLTSAELTHTTTGTVTLSGSSYTWTLTDANSDLVWDLNFASNAPSAASTLASMTTQSQAIGSQIAGFAMSTNYANMNTYDCGLFDQDGGCFSVGGRYSDVNGNNNTDSSSSALVAVGGYKLNNHFRVAGFIDQQVNSSTPNGINLDNKGPMVGMSLVWNQHPDHLGYQVKVANAYQSKDLRITRTATGDAEAGRGDTSMEVQSYVAEVSYQFSDGVKTAYRPYVALRRAMIKQDGYTETEVDNPLTFNTLEDKSTTVIMGMKAKYKLNAQVTLNGALGVEHDVDNDIDKLQATSSTITGLTAVDINSSINKTRPVATLGATYHISPNQTLSAQTQYQELAYTSTSAKTAYVNYTVGF